MSLVTNKRGNYSCELVDKYLVQMHVLKIPREKGSKKVSNTQTV